MTREEQPTSVQPAKQVGELQRRWLWVERAVWTDRMLMALERGVKGGVWFSLIDKVCSMRNLRAAYLRVAANRGSAGVDNQTIKAFERQLDRNLERLQRELRDGTYTPQAVKRTWIPKPGSSEKRPLGIPTVRDRVVQSALRNVLEPIFENEFAERSYGFRPNRGCKDALRQVDELLRTGHVYVVDADLKSYFDSIPRERLMEQVGQKIADSKVLTLLWAYLEQDVLDGLQRWRPEAGTPQGAVISPLLSNIYLDPLDHLAAQTGLEMVRYADDFVILCRSQEEAEAAMAQVQRWTDSVGLVLHPTKSHIAHAIDEGFEFLGYRFAGGKRFPRNKSQKKLKDTLRRRTKRTSGYSMQTIIAYINPVLRGWYEYFKHANRWVFKRLDSWIRGRLRAVLRRRAGGRGRARGNDQVKWPNAYFRRLGLLSLYVAWERDYQSARQRTINWRAVCGRTARTVRRGGRSR